MSAMMSDILMGTMNANTANAAVNAGGKLLKVAEMQRKFGQPQVPEEPTRELVLAPSGRKD